MSQNDVPPIGEEPPNLNATFINKVRTLKPVKTHNSVHRCIGCKRDFGLSELLPSTAGASWRKCPKCQMNFQLD